MVSDETLLYGAREDYPFDFLRTTVNKWTFLLVCVWLGHRSMDNQVGAQVVTRFHPVDPKREFPPIIGEPSTTREMAIAGRCTAGA